MKLVIAIVQDDDSAELIDSVTEAGFRVTKLATTGGFLKAGNTTLIIGVEEEKVNYVISLIEDTCKKRKQIINTTTPITGNVDIFMSYPIEVEVGGATIFVLDVDQFIRV
ncbi:cyclic-di-AMP receptor [Clostridium isatidis]|uniref:Transcriptional regulator n=1 Tax=Clostridium isatidis TaxID=182773 RepID=A0A343J9A4_9CLOT|nr:cyclic-di-AMP receptor [Clostridium isatidis]ASW42112.1 hypothetical protein BEN51_00990 [Clostridium isatidis]NLZ33915.1 hypothetical protein [Clostridiales bacterium]